VYKLKILGQIKQHLSVNSGMQINMLVAAGTVTLQQVQCCFNQWYFQYFRAELLSAGENQRRVS
jgi:hypothetical protein